ncbi:MAG TPA: hypothetical protein VEK79_14855 [Thermoanaerobaculia bacterium]|nr:hypothetical protein [Thermoanaerobaculia bacterium]
MEPVRWTVLTRIAFRFFFSFFALALPIPLFFQGPRFLQMSAMFWDAIVPPFAKTFFGLQVEQQQNGSGDSTWDWIQLFAIAMISLAITLVWSVFDRKRTAYPRLYVWFRAYVRFALAMVMIIYGTMKVIPLQFTAPPLDRLMQRVGDMSPMGLLWTFMGASPAYVIFSGLGELLGGLLLTMRRTALLGALVAAAVMLNVVVLNFSYDVPVKIFSSILLLAALFIAAPDAKRLLHLLVLNRPVETKPLEPAVRPPWLHNTLRIARTAVVIWFVAMSLQRTWTSRQQFLQNDARGELHGIWNVDDLTVDGVPRPPLLSDVTRWQRVVFTSTRGMAIEQVDARRDRYMVTHDLKGFILKKRDDPRWSASFLSERPNSNTLLLRGAMDGRNIVATLRRTPPRQFLLTSRGFHWINEAPYNR